MGKHDLIYRRFFSQPRMVEDLLREIVAEPWVERLDFSTLRRANAAFVSQGMEYREGDLVWRLEAAGRPPTYVCILLELQSRVDPFMAVRIMAYEALFYQSLLTEGELTSSGKLPLVVPVVLYNGERPWQAARDISDQIELADPTAEADLPRLRYRLIDVGRCSLEDLEGRAGPVAELFRLERSRNWPEIQRGAAWLAESLRDPGDRELRRIFETWLKKVVIPRMGGVPDEEFEPVSLEDFKDMLEERVQGWYRQEREKGRQEGRQEGRREGRREGEAELLLRQLRRKFGPLDEVTRAHIRVADPDTLLEWGERILSAECLDDVFGD